MVFVDHSGGVIGRGAVDEEGAVYAAVLYRQVFNSVCLIHELQAQCFREGKDHGFWFAAVFGDAGCAEFVEAC